MKLYFYLYFPEDSYTKVQWIVSNKLLLKKDSLHFIKAFFLCGFEWHHGNNTKTNTNVIVEKSLRFLFLFLGR